VSTIRFVPSGPSYFGLGLRQQLTQLGKGVDSSGSASLTGYLSVTTQPSSSATSGVVFPQQPVIQLRDGTGGTFARSGITVTASKASGGGTLGGTLTAVTNASGVATFTNLKLTGSGAHTLQFTATGYTSVTSQTITVTSPVAVALTGTIFGSTTEQNIVTGGLTVIATISNGTWGATVGQNNQITTDLLAGLDSAQSEAHGWDAEVKPALTYAMLTRNSSTQITLVLPARSAYDITVSETVTWTIPDSAVVPA
jgi:hypothetical protein